ncbi:MAG: desulfoferrodoxin family protein [candidate division NC10 bacterium]|nr:desulfoferrodoxin family protein [candidate division NC10 bacterium]
MKRLSLLGIGAVSLLLVALWVLPSWADVPTVSIQGPKEVKANQPFSITLTIVHQGNNFIHHISRLAIYVDGKEVKAWQYSWRSHPKEESWSISHELTLEQGATISAIATCNLHGPSKEATLAVLPSSSP